MADEVRRSGRATKGQHTKNEEEPEPKKKGKGGRPKKQAEPEPPPEEEGPAIIRCICGYVEEDENDEGAMICCDKCLAWQHNICMGMPTDDDELPDQYFCEQCKPKDHKELLAAIARGETPWIDRQAQHEREEQERKARRRKGGKKGRKSKAAVEKEVEPVAAPEKIPQAPVVEAKPETGQKRKAPADLVVETSSPAQTSSKSRKVSTPKDPKPTPRRQSTVAMSPLTRETLPPIQAELVENISDLQNVYRQRAATAFEKLFVEQTDVAKQQGTFKQAGGQSSAEFGLKLALKVEYALYLNFWGHGSDPNPPYGEKLRMMLHNVKKNPNLRDRLLNGLLSANAFTQMDSFEMASKEKQAETAKIMKETEKQHIIVHEDGPRIRRTHKGDEMIDDETQHLTGEHLYSNAPRRRESQPENNESQEGDGGRNSPNAVELPDDIKSPTSNKPLTVDTKTKPPPLTHRKSSSTFDINNVWSNVESPNAAHKPAGHYPPTPINTQDTHMQGVKADPEIDSLLKDEEEDEPYSPMDYEMEPGTIWRGNMMMPLISEFRASAKWGAGAPLDQLYPWDLVMPHTLFIEGRIDMEKAGEYLCNLRWSKTTNVTAVQVAPAEGAHDREQFDKLFDYLVERKRYGVMGKSPAPLVRDIYVLPLEAGDGKRPEFVELLEEGDIPPDGRAARSLIIAYVSKVNTAQSDSVQATPQQAGLAGSPVGPTGGVPQRTASMSAQGSLTPGQPVFSPQPGQGGGHTFSAPQNGDGGNSAGASQVKGWDAAKKILGDEFASSPSIVMLMQQAPDTGETEFKHIKEVLEQSPPTRVDLGQMMEALRRKMG